jgi:hypothetical protein
VTLGATAAEDRPLLVFDACVEDVDPVEAGEAVAPAVEAEDEEEELVFAAARPPKMPMPRTARAAITRLARETERTCASRLCDRARGRSSRGGGTGATRSG